MGLGSVLSTPVKAVGGLLGIHGSGPEAQSVDYDDQTKGLLETQKNRANESADDIVARNTAGMDEKANRFIDASQVSKPMQNTALGLNPMADDLDSALHQRAQRQYFDKSQISKSKQKLDANDQVISAEAGAANAVNAQTRQKLQAYSTQLKNQAAKKQARAQMFGSVLGLAGTAAGAYFGGAGGAIAGGKIGSGVGGGLGG